MCGILFVASGVALEGSGPCDWPAAARPCPSDFAAGLRCRGPDAQGHAEVRCGPATLSFHGSLLQLRGTQPGSTPLVDAAGNVLLFNGQLFGGGVEVPPGTNDAAALLASLGQPGTDVPVLLASLQGPWALAYWHATTSTLWFGRDPIGRRSLLLHLPRHGEGRFMLSSSAPLRPAVPFEGFRELPPGICSLKLEQPRGKGSSSGSSSDGTCSLAAVAGAADALSNGSNAGDGHARSHLPARYTRHEWPEASVRQLAAFTRAAELVEPAAAGDDTEDAAAFEATVDAVLAALRRAVATRCRCIDERQPQLVAAGAAAAGAVGAAGAAAAGAVGAAGAGGLLRQLQQLELDSTALQGTSSSSSSSSSDNGSHSSSSGCSSTLHPTSLLPPAPVLVLFSGGVDSTLLAALAHEALPPGVPIDLASVCFDDGGSPDRRSALDALDELRAFAPGRQWRLIQVDSSMQEVAAAQPRLLRLLAPADTVMDLNIGAALWLAARGEGTLLAPPQQAGQQGAAAAAADAAPAAASDGRAAGQHGRKRLQDGAQPPAMLHEFASSSSGSGSEPSGNAGTSAPLLCRSVARVVLLGHGADELCGGYGRHRTAFRNGDWPGLAGELQLDMSRLWLRNLGRDDRLVADHGREARHPFLDEGVVAATLAAPLWHLADLRHPPGQGDKRVLRACLARLGLPRAAQRAKRAIQFGSRLAAKSNTALFGGTHRANLANAGSVSLSAVPLLQPE